MALSEKRPAWGIPPYVVCLGITDGYAIPIKDDEPHMAPEDHKQGWQPETLFGCPKTRGFHPEDAHLGDRGRISELPAAVTIAFCRSYGVGDRSHDQKPTGIKKHGRMSESIFGKGPDPISSVVLNPEDRYSDFRQLIVFLSCT